MYVYIYIYSIYSYVHIYICTHIYIYIYIHTCIHTYMHACMYVCMYVCAYICIHTHACMHMYENTRADVCVCVCLYMYIYIYIYTKKHMVARIHIRICSPKCICLSNLAHAESIRLYSGLFCSSPSYYTRRYYTLLLCFHTVLHNETVIVHYAAHMYIHIQSTEVLNPKPSAPNHCHSCEGRLRKGFSQPS